MSGLAGVLRFAEYGSPIVGLLVRRLWEVHQQPTEQTWRWLLLNHPPPITHTLLRFELESTAQ